MKNKRIKNLRRRLGWSIADLARRMNCESLQIAKWENGEEEPDKKIFDMLELLEHHVDTNRSKTIRESLADQILKNSSFDQVDLSEWPILKLGNI